MRQGVLILILAAACASGDTKQNSLRIDVTQARGERFNMVGQHVYTVRLTNISPGPVEVQSIQLKPAGATDFSFDDAILTVGDDLAYAESREYPISVTVAAQSMSSPQYIMNINSLSVTVACRSESGNFIVSEDVPIQVRN